MKNTKWFIGQVLIWLCIVCVMGACNPMRRVDFPEDGHYRYLVFLNFGSSYYENEVGSFTAEVYLYNLDLEKENILDSLALFAQYYYCYRSETKQQKYFKGVIDFLSDPYEYNLAPHYYDSANPARIQKKIRYSLVTKYDTLTNQIAVYRRLPGKAGKETPLDYPARHCSTIQALTDSIFIPIEANHWHQVHDLAKEAWDAAAQ